MDVPKDPRVFATFRPGNLDPQVVRARQQRLNEEAAALRAAAERRYRLADIEIPFPPEDSYHLSGRPPLAVYTEEETGDDDLKCARGIINGLMLSCAFIAILVFVWFILQGWF